MNPEARFGQNFEVNDMNRMDVLKNQELPEYVDLSREARERLKQSLETEGWPEAPHHLNNIEDLFETARHTVDERWNKYVRELIEQKSAAWLKNIPKNKDTEDIRDVLSDSEKLESAMQMRQFDILEGLRSVAPDAWRSLVLLSSERQLASITLMRHWRESLNDSDVEQLGMNKAELGVFLDAAGILGKYVDHAYVKQIELADAPGGSIKTPLGETPGAAYLYDVYNAGNDSSDLKTYKEVFPFEWQKLVSRFEGLAAKVDTLLQDHKIPESYAPFPGYLRQMAETYNSDSTTPQELHEKWQNLMERCGQLAQEGCPMMIIPQNCPSVAGDANKIDVELRFGLRTEKTNSLEQQFEQLQATAQQFIAENERAVDTPSEAPPVVLNYQPFAHGSDLFLYTMAENSERLVISHTNAVADVATGDEMPFVKKMFGIEAEPVPYGNAALRAAGGHELGHTVVLNTDKAVAKRVGASNDAWILEELKGEVMGVKIIKETVDNKRADIDLKTQFTAELGTLCSYLDGSKEPGSFGERYYYAATAIIHRLMEKGIIQQKGSGWTVTNPEQGIAVIAELADEVLKLYTTDTTKPKDVKAYIKQIKADAKGDKIKQFVKKLKS